MAIYTRGSIKAFFGQAALRAYYTFDNSNKLLEESGNGFHLTERNSPTYQKGKFGYGFYVPTNIEGAGAKSLDSRSDIGINGGSVSILVWAKATANPSNNVELVIFGEEANPASAGNYLLYKNVSGTLYITATRLRSSVAWDYVNYQYSNFQKDFHFLVYTYDGTNIKLYLNGVLVATGTSSGTGGNNYGTYGVSIGGRFDGVTNNYQGFSGYIDEGAIYKKVFTAQEIARYYEVATKLKKFRLSSFLGSFSASYTVALAQGAYTLTGEVVNLLKSLNIAITQGSYTLTGYAINLLRGWHAFVDYGSYVLTGMDAALYKGIGYVIAAAQGAYTLTGQAISVIKAISVSLAQGAYVLTGEAVGMIKAKIISAAKGSYLLTGKTVNFTKGLVMALVQGAYTLTGQAVTFAAHLFRQVGVIHGKKSSTGITYATKNESEG